MTTELTELRTRAKQLSKTVVNTGRIEPHFFCTPNQCFNHKPIHSSQHAFAVLSQLYELSSFLSHQPYSKLFCPLFASLRKLQKASKRQNRLQYLLDTIENCRHPFSFHFSFHFSFSFFIFIFFFSRTFCLMNYVISYAFIYTASKIFLTGKNNRNFYSSPSVTSS